MYDRIITISDLGQSCMSGSCAPDQHARRLQVPKMHRERWLLIRDTYKKKKHEMYGDEAHLT